eukprot:TRINITY_DN17314_c0_g2_i1.p1 TRINITY_DN17314_c0_g2~~TRINITY_DN17314_c0_g2_i1.p1  ORF type:complete len:245 (-),score=27.12 TRINITY_DN17314_c0_g2_i1:60-794(-)
MSFNNAQVYKVQDRIRFINKNFLELDKQADFILPPTVVFVSPPWGGVNYSKVDVYNFNTIRPNFELIVRKSLELSDNLVLFLPRSINLSQLAKVLFQNPKLFTSQSKECFVTIEALIYREQFIKALFIHTGPMFLPKPNELIVQIKGLFNNQLKSYESIIIQNIMKARTFTDCYEMALETIKKRMTANECIGRLKGLFNKEEWEIVKKLHKGEAKSIGILNGKRIPTDDLQAIETEPKNKILNE